MWRSENEIQQQQGDTRHENRTISQDCSPAPAPPCWRGRCIGVGGTVLKVKSTQDIFFEFRRRGFRRELAPGESLGPAQCLEFLTAFLAQFQMLLYFKTRFGLQPVIEQFLNLFLKMSGHWWHAYRFAFCV